MSNLLNEIKYGIGPLRALALGTGVGEGEGVMRIDESLSPIIDWWQRPDWAILAGDVLACGIVFRAAAVGFRSQAALINPPNSGRIIILEQVAAPGGMDVIARFLEPAPVNGAGGWTALAEQETRDLRDSRQVARLLVNNSAAVAGGAGVYRITRATISYLPVILTPDTAVLWDPNADNTALDDLSIAWRERFALPGEL